MTRGVNRRQGRGRVRLALVVLLLLVAGIAAYFYRDYREFASAPLPRLTETTPVDVPLGTSVAGVVRILEQRGIATGNPWYECEPIFKYSKPFELQMKSGWWVDQVLVKLELRRSARPT